VDRSYATGEHPAASVVGRALDAGVLLDGHIQRAGELVRVTVQLTDVKQGSIVWAATFDQPTAELFKLEDAIAERVAGELRLQLAAAEQARLKRRYTQNGPAYLSYLDGREALLRYTPDGTRQAVAAFERALTLDAGYALARAGLATASADMYLRFAREPELQQWGERAEREAAEAIAMDPDLAEAHVARAAVLRKREFDWDETIVVSRRALRLNPNLDQPHFYAAAAFYHFGLMDESARELDHGRRVGGRDVVEPLRIEALVALFSGNYGVARQRLEEVSRRSNRAIGDVYLALAYYYSGDENAARSMLQSLANESSASTAARAGSALASLLAASGDAATARGLVERVLAREYRDHHVFYTLGVAFAQLGDHGQAITFLRTAADNGFPCVTWFATDPLLQPLRSDSRFVALTADLAARRSAAAAKHGGGKVAE
jgi:Flp pilus assembly protein TadD